MRREKSIAVLPLANLSPNIEDELFCDGLTEEIINALAHIQNTYVTSRTSSFFFKKHSLSVSEIAEKLGVKYIIEGSVRRAGNDARITIQLINALEDYHYWSKSFDYKLDNVFEIQDEVSRIVKEKFRELTGHFDIEEKSGAPIKRSITAYEYIQRARRKASDISNEGVQKGLGYINKAIELEPDHAMFHAAKATYLAALAIMGSMDSNETYKRIIESTTYALELDPDNAEANAIAGHVAFALHGDMKKFRHYINKARSLKYSDTYSLYFTSVVESAMGNYDATMHALDITEELDPLSQLPHYFRTVSLMRLRYFDQALEYADRFLKDYPNHLNVYSIQGLVLLRMGKPKIALAHFVKMPLPDGKTVPYYGGMAMAFALLGNITEAEEHLELALKEDGKLFLSYKENPKVMVNLLLGRFDEAFKELEKDVLAGEWYTRFYRTNPFFDSILNDPRAKIFDKAIINESPQINGTKYAKSGLSENEIDKIEEKLVDHIEKDKPYLNPELSLKQLAKSIGVSANHLSQVINSQKRKNFFDFINTYRIKELMGLMNDENNRKFTILSLALQAGFNSKSTFNSSFKKITGLTPSEYMKRVNVSN